MDDELKPKLVFNRQRDGDKVTLTVSHDRAKSIFGWGSRDNVGLEMPGDFWVKVIPSLVVLLTTEEKAEVLAGIAERLGVVAWGAAGESPPLGLQVYRGEGVTEPAGAVAGG